MTKIEGVIAIKDKDELVAVVWRNKDGHRLFYEVKEMGDEEIMRLLNRNEGQINQGTTA